MTDDSPANETKQPDSTDSTPLDHVIDDLEPKLAWGEWAVEEMKKGRSPDDLSAELIASGWDEDDAAELVEAARRQTRHLRGVITRDDVARENASRYHKAMAVSAFSAFRFVSVFWLAAIAARQVLNSLAFVLGSRRPRPASSLGFPVEPAPRTETEGQPDTAKSSDEPHEDEGSTG